MVPVWLYTDLLQALKGEPLNFVLSTEGTLISASTAPNCGGYRQETPNNASNHNRKYLTVPQLNNRKHLTLFQLTVRGIVITICFPKFLFNDLQLEQSLPWTTATAALAWTAVAVTLTFALLTILLLSTASKKKCLQTLGENLNILSRAFLSFFCSMQRETKYMSDTRQIVECAHIYDAFRGQNVNKYL